MPKPCGARKHAHHHGAVVLQEAAGLQLSLKEARAAVKNNGSWFGKKLREAKEDVEFWKDQGLQLLQDAQEVHRQVGWLIAVQKSCSILEAACSFYKPELPGTWAGCVICRDLQLYLLCLWRTPCWTLMTQNSLQCLSTLSQELANMLPAQRVINAEQAVAQLQLQLQAERQANARKLVAERKGWQVKVERLQEALERATQGGQQKLKAAKTRHAQELAELESQKSCLAREVAVLKLRLLAAQQEKGQAVVAESLIAPQGNKLLPRGGEAEAAGRLQGMLELQAAQLQHQQVS